MSKRKFFFVFLGSLLWCLAGAASSTNPSLQVDFSFSSGAQYSPNSIIVPFVFNGGLVIVKARVEEMEGNFVLDTGASGLILNERYFTADQELVNLQGMGLGGATSPIGELEVDSLELEELSFQRVKAQTLDLTPIEQSKKSRILGLIGYDILKDFEILFDYRQRILTFSKTDQDGNILTVLPHTLNKADSLSFRLANFIPLIEVEVNGKKKMMGMDTGAEYNLLNIKRCKDVLSAFAIKKTIEVASPGGKKIEALVGKLARVILKDKYRCGTMSTVLTNLKDLETIYACKLDGILGYDFFATWLVSINYKKQVLYLHPFNSTKP